MWSSIVYMIVEHSVVSFCTFLTPSVDPNFKLSIYRFPVHVFGLGIGVQQTQN